MAEFLSNYGLWIVLGGIFVAMHMFGMGCGMGGHSHGSEPSRKGEADPHAGHASGAGSTHKHDAGASTPPRRRGGCC